MGWKNWSSGEEVLATEFQTYLQNQVVQTYAGTAARSSALGTATSEGMVSYLADVNKIQYYDGAAWQDVSGSGGTATYATTAGTAAYATAAGTAVYATTSGTATYATLAGTATYATTSGTAVYATNAGTAASFAGTIASTQVTGTAVTRGDTATVTNTMLAGSIANDKLVNSIITMNGTAVSLGGSVTITGGTITGMTNPMTTQGDLIVGGASGNPGRLGIGTSGYVLTSDGTAATWSAASGSSLPDQTGNAGELLITNGTAASWSNTVTANATTTPAIIAKGLASQTASLQQWQDSSGTTLASITSTGLINATPYGSPATANTASHVGYMGLPQVSTGTGLTLSEQHSGKHIYSTTTGISHGLPVGVQEIGTTIVFINPASVTTTITATGNTLILAGSGVKTSVTLAPFGMATAVKIATSTWMISGNGLT